MFSGYQSELYLLRLCSYFYTDTIYLYITLIYLVKKPNNSRNLRQEAIYQNKAFCEVSLRIVFSDMKAIIDCETVKINPGWKCKSTKTVPINKLRLQLRNSWNTGNLHILKFNLNKKKSENKVNFERSNKRKSCSENPLENFELSYVGMKSFKTNES